VTPGGDVAPAFEEEYFTRVYRHYARQNPPRKLAMYRRLLERHLSAQLNPRILDVGCGPGSFLASLGGGWRKAGLDVSHYGVGIARARNPGAALVVGSAEHLPFKGPFDAIVSFDVIEHVVDPAAAFDEILSRLAPSGVFVFVVPVYDGLSAPIIRVLDRDPTHLHKRPRSFWLDLAQSRFDVREWFGLVRYLLPGGWYFNWATRAMRHHAPAVAVVARRAA
jgi:SAM-dependent methyltransferase